MGFRVGRKHAQHVYPQSPAAGGGGGMVGPEGPEGPPGPPGPPAPFARNFAHGPASEVPVTTVGTLIPWSTVGFGPPGTDVHITPQSTGELRVSGTVGVAISTENDFVTVQIQVNGVTQATPISFTTIPATGAVEIPFLFEVSGLSIGFTANIDILVTMSSGSAILGVNLSTIDVQEVSLPTG